jgi:type IV pilus assembly protein PilC
MVSDPSAQQASAAVSDLPLYSPQCGLAVDVFPYSGERGYQNRSLPMLFSARLSLGDLANFCRSLRHSLGAGISVVDVVRQQSQRGPAALRPVAGRVAGSLTTGASLSEALEKENDSFPALFLSLARVGEETGHLPEVFKELEQYFDLELKLRRQFIAQSTLPVLQFFFAIFLIAGLIWILGVIGAGQQARPITIFGLSGGGGAATFLAVTLGTLAVLVAGFVFCKRKFRNLAALDLLLLRTPVVGPCLEALAMSRLCLALQLTLDSGMTIMHAIRLSLNATGNSAFAVHTQEAAAALKEGKPLTQALMLVKPLPAGFTDLAASAEEAGRVPEMMRQQAAYYQEESFRRLTFVTRMASGLLWLIYAAFMIFAIFSLAQVYLNHFAV